MFSKKLLIQNKDSPYLIYRLTYAECQAYHSSLTLGYVIKNRDEKFKVVAIANNLYINNNGYIYGNSDDPLYTYSRFTDSQWYELRVYCDDSIMNLGSFFLRDFYVFTRYEPSTYLYFYGDGRDLVYDASGGYYSVFRSDRQQQYSGDYTSMSINTISAIQDSFNLYAAQVRDNPQSDPVEFDQMRTVEVEFDYNSSYELNVEGLLVTINSDTLNISLQYSSQNLSLQFYRISLNQSEIAQIPVYANSDSRVYTIPSNAPDLINGINSLTVVARLSDNSESISENTFVYNA
jgi:hypothetical protein